MHGPSGRLCAHQVLERAASCEVDCGTWLEAACTASIITIRSVGFS